MKSSVGWKRRHSSAVSARNQLSGANCVTCSCIAASLWSMNGPTSTRVVFGPAASAICFMNASRSARCSSVSSSSPIVQAADAALLEQLLDLVAAREVQHALVELQRLPRGQALVLQLLRVPGRVAGALEGQLGHLGGADVVGMAVAAEVVVADDDLRAASGARSERAGRRPRRHPPARSSRRLVLGRAHHPGVDVAEPMVLDRARAAPGRAAAPPGADLAQPGVVLRRVELGHDDLAVLATGAGDADHAVAGAAVPAP